MFSIWTKGIGDSLKRTPGEAARLTSLRNCISLNKSTCIVASHRVLAECNPIFQCLEQIPCSQPFSENILDPSPHFISGLWCVLGQADVSHVLIE